VTGRSAPSGTVRAVLTWWLRLPAQGQAGHCDRDGGSQYGQADDLPADEPYVERQTSGKVDRLG
jgi:hypothetical protein